MADHDLSAGGDVLDRVTACARAALADYGVRPDAEVRLLNVSENATFLVSDPDAGPSVLRVHRLGYHSEQAIASELAWMDALRAEAGVRTPRVLPAADGRRIVSVTDHGVSDSALRPATACGSSSCPAPSRRTGGGDGAAAHFAELGEITARMHGTPGAWDRPAWFTRFRWDVEAAFGPAARWGRWQDGIGVGAGRTRVLGRLERRLRGRLAAFGTGPGAVRAGARRHPAGQPAGATTDGQRDRLRRLRVRLVPVRPGHRGQLLRARTRTCPPWSTAGWTGTAARASCRPRTRRRSGRSSCSGGCCWSPGSARTRPSTSPPSWGRVHPRQLRPGRVLPRPVTAREGTGRFLVHIASRDGPWSSPGAAAASARASPACSPATGPAS